ncbi:hypothetical protein K2P97_04690 [bacterium]|nr:hypothetical protein [bacterium]
MKIILVFLFLTISANAQTQTPPPISEQYRWLYEILFDETDRIQQPNEAFKSFYVHLADSDLVFPKPSDIEAKNLKPVQTVEGTITYVNVIKKRYTYDILKTADGIFVINVRIHLKDPVGADLNNFREKIRGAQDIWNAKRVAADFEYVFKFDLVESEAEARYSVNVFDTTRGPYDRNWGRDWTPNVVAHEIGHMMGLGDEYQTLSGKFDCMKTSLMCTAWSGALMKHHYYFILRRLINQ